MKNDDIVEHLVVRTTRAKLQIGQGVSEEAADLLRMVCLNCSSSVVSYRSSFVSRFWSRTLANVRTGQRSSSTHGSSRCMFAASAPWIELMVFCVCSDWENVAPKSQPPTPIMFQHAEPVRFPPLFVNYTISIVLSEFRGSSYQVWRAICRY